MQTTLSFDGEDDFFFMNQNLNGSISDLFFDNIIPSEEVISGSPSDSPTSSPPPSYMPIPNIQPNIIFKQESNSPIEEFQDYQPPKIQPLVENNKRKRINAKVEKEKEKDNKEKTNKNPAPKKIRKKHPEMQTSVTLSREKLLTTSTEEFNKWVEELKSSRSLTQEEVQDIRRQKRLIRNRESAQASRDRKKNEFMMLEKQIKQLKEEKDMALRELSEMKNKMNNLENENLFMRSTIQHNPVLNEMYTGIGNIQNTKNTNNSFINSKTVKNAGVCLFLLIFSFGLFFNVQNSMSQSQPKVYMPQNIPSSLPINTPNNPLRSLGTNARKLLSKTKTQINGLDISNHPTQQTLPVISEPIVPLLVKSVTTGISTTNETVIHQNQQNNTIQPNVHLYCLNAKEYIIDGSKDSKDLIISLMLPRNTISQNSPIHNHVNSNDELIEVTCKVLSPFPLSPKI